MVWFLWLKTVHIVAVVSWFAGLFYLPRLFVYHTETCEGDRRGHLRFCVMEKKLFYIIILPASGVVLLTGLGLLAGFLTVYIKQPWMWAKLILVSLLYGYMFLLWKHLKAFEKEENKKSGRYFRVINEMPTVLLIIVVALVVIKPQFF